MDWINFETGQVFDTYEELVKSRQVDSNEKR